MENTSRHDQQLDKIIRQHTLSSVGVGFLPVPGMDLVSLLAIQSNMIKELAAVYQIPFMKEAVKNILSSLIGNMLLVNAMPVLASIVKTVPLLGQGVGMATMPVTCGASTYAAGKVFIRHFESGGDLANFDPDTMKTYYKEKLQEGKKIAQKLNNKERKRRK